MDATERAVMDKCLADLAEYHYATREDVERALLKSGFYERRLFAKRLRELGRVVMEPFTRRIVEPLARRMSR